METFTDLLVIGAGPFGLATAHARHLGVDYRIVGKSMEFWRVNMPAGMYLRSACDWHLDPANDATIEKFLRLQGLAPADVEPLSRQLYVRYAEWFQEQKHIEAHPVYIRRLDHTGGEVRRFSATLDNGDSIAAKHVVIAVGFKYFKHVPSDIAERLPAGRYGHTCDLVEFEALRGKRCLIVGGRQSAFEWAALIGESGAAAVHVSHRHDSPAFQASDWSWVNPLVEAIADQPGWFRNLSPAEQDSVNHRLWAEGRLKVEPWLEARVNKASIKLWPNTQIIACDELATGEVAVTLDNRETLAVDQVILATGYKVNIDQVPFLAQGNILETLKIENGFPVLDEHFQTNIPGLFITSMAAVQGFGPFWGFTIAVRTSAKLIGQAIVRNRSAHA